MPTKRKGRKSVPPLAAAVVQPLSIRLSRMEGLLIEMRAEQDMQLKKINQFRMQFDELKDLIKRS
jgi:hypothetical protein